ncbi:MAG: hypothetical protein IKN30_07460, partial [Synergistaceae bacterium]|nr:hypothetical protein [Synergistaceae bacterium]
NYLLRGDKMLENFAVWGAAAVVAALSVIQLSPLKINPWDSLFSWLGEKLNNETEKKLDKLEKQVNSMWVNSHRNTILRFARESRNSVEHSYDEWKNLLNVAEEYEKYVHDVQITNGVITQDTAYLRDLYQELSREHRI